mmetsp:Transcript_39188/g.92095  ORF Transcript_39188/g.92095 Transcript_39188/m.92095 type:complete len:211 (+) Transcript_39188:1258-1890(+)
MAGKEPNRADESDSLVLRPGVGLLSDEHARRPAHPVGLRPDRSPGGLGVLPDQAEFWDTGCAPRTAGDAGRPRPNPCFRRQRHRLESSHQEDRSVCRRRRQGLRLRRGAGLGDGQAAGRPDVCQRRGWRYRRCRTQHRAVDGRSESHRFLRDGSGHRLPEMAGGDAQRVGSSPVDGDPPPGDQRRLAIARGPYRQERMGLRLVVQTDVGV